MFVAAGAAKRLRDQERKTFLAHVWPSVRAQIDRLGFDARELLDQTDA